MQHLHPGDSLAKFLAGDDKKQVTFKRPTELTLYETSYYPVDVKPEKQRTQDEPTDRSQLASEVKPHKGNLLDWNYSEDKELTFDKRRQQREEV